jgi:hypothetical protein
MEKREKRLAELLEIFKKIGVGRWVTLSELYDEVSQSDLDWPASYRSMISSIIQSHSSNSACFCGDPGMNFFQSREIRSGIWKLKPGSKYQAYIDGKKPRRMRIPKDLMPF